MTIVTFGLGTQKHSISFMNAIILSIRVLARIFRSQGTGRTQVAKPNKVEGLYAYDTEYPYS